MLFFRIGLRLLSFQYLHRLAHRPANRYADTAERIEQELLVRAVNRASKYIPGQHTCLAQALTGMYLLKRSGYPAQLRIGVRKEDQNRLIAHAWIENEGMILIGDPQDERDTYTQLPDFHRAQK